VTRGTQVRTAYVIAYCLDGPEEDGFVENFCADAIAPVEPPTPLLVHRGDDVFIHTHERTQAVHAWPVFIDRHGTRIVGHLRHGQVRDRRRTRFKVRLGKVNPRANGLALRVYVKRGTVDAVVGLIVRR
jgi:hypothetical protein